jgi:hypothetical protein
MYHNVKRKERQHYRKAASGFPCSSGLRLRTVRMPYIPFLPVTPKNAEAEEDATPKS